MALDYNDLAVFLRVAREGSFAAAAHRLSMPTSTVSRRVAALEAQLGLQLLRRTTRAVSLTDDGRAYAERCTGFMEEIDAATGALLDRSGGPVLRGTLKVTAPVLAGVEQFGPWLLDFAALHSSLRLELVLTNSLLDLVEDSIDLAFRLGPLGESSLVARKLWQVSYVLCASKEFIERAPLSLHLDHPNRLASQPCVVTPPVVPWLFHDETGAVFSFVPRGEIGASVNDLPLGVAAVRRGLGIGYLPRDLIRAEPGLVEVPLDGWKVQPRGLFAVYPPSRQLSPKVRAAIDFILERRERGRETPIKA